jgi:hypothetical protein
MLSTPFSKPGSKVRVKIDEKCRVRFCSPDARLDLSIFTEYISVEVYNQTPKNKLEKYLISGGTYRLEKYLHQFPAFLQER